MQLVPFDILTYMVFGRIRSNRVENQRENQHQNQRIRTNPELVPFDVLTYMVYQRIRTNRVENQRENKHQIQRIRRNHGHAQLPVSGLLCLTIDASSDVCLNKVTQVQWYLRTSDVI